MDKKLRIALVSTDYPPLQTSAAVQMHDLAKEMSESGYEPLVIVPSYSIKSPWAIDNLDGVVVLRLASPRFRDISYLKRTLSEFMLPFIMWFNFRKSALFKQKIDLIAWYSPSIFLGPFIWKLKRRNKCTAYLILRDIFPEWAHDLGLMSKGLIYYFFKSIALFQYFVADTIGVQTKSNIPYISPWAKRFGRKLEVLYNWQRNSVKVKSSIDIHLTPLAARKIFVYIGNMGVAQNLDIFLELAKSLNDRADIGFLFIGRGSEVPHLKSIAKSLQLKNILFFNEIPHQEMSNLLSQCYAGLIALDPRHKTHNIPGKFLTYLLAGLPIIARLNAGTDLSTLIHNAQAGFSIEGEDSYTLMQQKVELMIANPVLYKDMSKNALRLAKDMFDPKHTVQKIIQSTTDKTS